jgi:hypothetical protein
MMAQQHQADGLNRRLRRELQRAERTAARPRRAPKPIALNAVQMAKMRATRLTDTERAELLRPAHEGFRALREGVATFAQWAAVNTVVHIAQAIEDQGVIRGMREHFAAGDLALEAVCKRVQQAEGGPSWGHRTTLYFDEIAAIRELIHLHDEQLKVLSAGELHAATKGAERAVIAAGGRVLKSIPDNPAAPDVAPTQEKLL